MLKYMLQFNPLLRPTAADCLKHPYFDNLREKVQIESTSPFELDAENFDGLKLTDLRENFNHVLGRPHANL